jgi:hypothetical protein
MKNYKLISRIAADILTIALLAWAPLWIIVFCLIAFSWLFAPYYEIIVWGLAYDALYGLHSIYGLITALLIFVIIEVLRMRTRI